jgi:hypothetical protein
MKHLVLLLCNWLVFATVVAQPFTRYRDTLFQNVGITRDVVYGSNYVTNPNSPVDLMMDIYQPLGDTATRRAAIMLVPYTAMLPTSVFQNNLGFPDPAGTRNDFWITEAARRFAKMGYVVAIVSHRLGGWNPTSPDASVRQQGLIQATWRAMQDVRGAIRYLKQDAKTTNLYRLDTQRIAAGGSASGAYATCFAAFFNKPAELLSPPFAPLGTSFIDTTTLGGFEGNTNATPAQAHNTSKFHAWLSFGGGVMDSSLIEQGDIPIIALHSESDPNTSPDSRMLFVGGTLPVFDVHGSRALIRRWLNVGNSHPFSAPQFANDAPPGMKLFTSNQSALAFEPWNYKNPSAPNGYRQTLVDSSKLYLDTLITHTRDRLFPALNLPTITYPGVVTARNIALQRSLAVYPNPAKSKIQLGQLLEGSLILIDTQGREVWTQQLNATNAELALPTVTPGIYLLQVVTPEGERWSTRLAIQAD